jgi:hypothetical protein
MVTVLTDADLAVSERPITVLVTGAAGFIGSHTCAELLGHGYEVDAVGSAPFYEPGLAELLHRPSQPAGSGSAPRWRRPQASGCPLHLRRNPAASGLTRRRPGRAARRRQRAGSAAAPELPAGRQVNGPGWHRGRAECHDRPTGPAGPGRQARLEPRVSPRGPGGTGHAAPGPAGRRHQLGSGRGPAPDGLCGNAAGRHPVHRHRRRHRGTRQGVGHAFLATKV